MKNSPIAPGLRLAAALGLALSLSCSARHHATHVGVHNVAPPVSPPTPTPEIGTSSTPAKKVVIYVPSGEGEDDLRPKTVRLSDSQDPARAALDALLETDHSPLPSGTTLRGIKIESSLATVDFSQEFQANFHGGETEEADTVNSILRTLGQFSDIDRVQILVDGKPIDALSQLPISGPLDVIRPDPVLQAKNAAAHN